MEISVRGECEAALYIEISGLLVKGETTSEDTFDDVVVEDLKIWSLSENKYVSVLEGVETTTEVIRLLENIKEARLQHVNEALFEDGQE